MFQEEPKISVHQIAEAVLKLSDFYIAYPDSTTPWDEEFCQIAYRYYYLPLNFFRCRRVISKGDQLGFFTDLSHFIDWGCGPGTASLAFAESPLKGCTIQKQILIDQSKQPLKGFDDLHSILTGVEKTTDISLKKYLDQKTRTCLTFSYSLTEVEELPSGWDQFEALMILEPSTSQDGRKLLQLRRKLIEKGYSIWAPCTHQLTCPLLTESGTDWCHDRIVVDAAAWFWRLDNLLPMKNKTITTSYLLARKKPGPAFEKNMARLTGDSRHEKGKTRQLVCRNEKREFLTWMHKKIEPQVFPRGELVRLNKAIEEKSNELRVLENCEVVTTFTK